MQRSTSVATVLVLFAFALAVSAAVVHGALAPTATAYAMPSAQGGQVRAVVGGVAINVRAGPSTAHAVVGLAAAGQTLDVLGRSNDSPPWYEVCCVAGGKTGWVRSDLVTLNPAGGQVALAASIPTPPPAAKPAPRPAQPAAAGYIAPPPPPPAGGPPGTNPFTGLAGGNLNRRPVFVCVNNDAEARPQYGLNAADVVYEYVMEGRAITRYAALYWSQDVPRIGPVRSARLINTQLPSLYGAALLCSGASNPVRYILKNQVYFPYLDVDLDDPSNTVYSVSIGKDYRTRLQTDSGRLEKFLRARNANWAPGTRGLRFGDCGGGKPAARVAIPYPRPARTSWSWDGSQWTRFGSNGAAYLDAATGAQITADNVVVQWAEHQATNIVEDSLGTRSIRILLLGTGKAAVLRDGKIIEGTWRADDPNQPPEFFDASGAPIALHPGRTWFEIVEPHYQLTIE